MLSNRKTWSEIVEPGKTSPMGIPIAKQDMSQNQHQEIQKDEQNSTFINSDSYMDNSVVQFIGHATLEIKNCLLSKPLVYSLNHAKRNKAQIPNFIKSFQMKVISHAKCKHTILDRNSSQDHYSSIERERWLLMLQNPITQVNYLFMLLSSLHFCYIKGYPS